MKRLTTDTPEGNLENIFNLFYIKDDWTFVRGGGPSPDYMDVSLCDFARELIRKYNAERLDPDLDDLDLSDSLDEALYDGIDTIEGLIATLYTAGWAFACLRGRLKLYEDTGLAPEEITEIVNSTQQEAEVKLPVCDGFDWVKNVQVSKQLAPHLKPYHGCPRGPMGLPGVDPCNVSMAKLLRDAKDLILTGQDETFVCVPEMWYERCVKALEKIQEAEQTA